MKLLVVGLSPSSFVANAIRDFKVINVFAGDLNV